MNTVGEIFKPLCFRLLLAICLLALAQVSCARDVKAPPDNHGPCLYIQELALSVDKNVSILSFIYSLSNTTSQSMSIYAKPGLQCKYSLHVPTQYHSVLVGKFYESISAGRSSASVQNEIVRIPPHDAVRKKIAIQVAPVRADVFYRISIDATYESLPWKSKPSTETWTGSVSTAISRTIHAEMVPAEF